MKPVILLGAGGHARVLLDTLRLRKIKVLGLVENDEEAFKHSPSKVLLVNGVGSVRADARREAIFNRFKERGYSFLTVVHPSAVVAKDAELGEGAQVMAGAVIQTGSVIGKNSIVNTRASVDHDARIGAHVHLAPGAVLSGEVTVGDNSHLGTGAVVVNGIKIGAGVFVAANSLVCEDLADGTVLKAVRPDVRANP